MNSSSPSLRGSEILSSLHLTRVRHQIPQPDGSPSLDRSLFVPTPTPCTHRAEMLQTFPTHLVHVALLGLDKSCFKALATEIEASAAPDSWPSEPKARSNRMKHRVNRRLQEQHPFHWLTPSFLGCTLATLLRLHQRLPVEDRNLAAVVLPDAPVHYYADLDGTASWCLRENAAVRCIEQFIRAFRTFFRRTFSRSPDLSGMHWSRSLHPRKLSLHVHISTEAFDSVSTLGTFHAALMAWLQHRDPDRYPCLGKWTVRHTEEEEKEEEEEEKEDEYEWNTIFDSSVYSRYRLFRMNGHCKPGGPMLVQWLPPEEDTFAACPKIQTIRWTRLSEEELLFRCLPNYALPAKGYVYLTLARPSRKRPREEVTKKQEKKKEPPDKSSTSLSPIIHSQLLKAIKPFLGPSVVLDDHWTTRNGGFMQIYCEKETAWCWKRNKAPLKNRIHGSNRTCISIGRSALFVRCLDPDCVSKCKMINAPRLCSAVWRSRAENQNTE